MPRRFSQRSGGDYDAAEQPLLASLKLRETANALNNLGAIRASQRRDADAIVHFRRAVQLEAADPVYWLNLADVARRLQLTSESIAAYGKGLELARAELAQNPRLGLTRASVAHFAARLGDVRTAQDDSAEALKFSPGDSKVVRRVVLTYEALGRRADALAVLATAGLENLREIERHPDLADLARDSRFRKLIESATRGGRDHASRD